MQFLSCFQYNKQQRTCNHVLFLLEQDFAIKTNKNLKKPNSQTPHKSVKTDLINNFKIPNLTKFVQI